MKRFALFIIALFSFGILSANCAAPINLMLKKTIEAPQTVHLTYEYGNLPHPDPYGTDPDELIGFRARNESGTWLDISQIAVDPFVMDIGTDPCVPAGMWTYIIPFHCNTSSCGCRNYDEIEIPEHGANCIDTAQPTALTSEEFAAKMRSESWYESPDYSSRDEATAITDDTEEPDLDEPEQEHDDTQTEEKKESSVGCSLVIL